MEGAGPGGQLTRGRAALVRCGAACQWQGRDWCDTHRVAPGRTVEPWRA